MAEKVFRKKFSGGRTVQKHPMGTSMIAKRFVFPQNHSGANTEKHR